MSIKLRYLVRAIEVVLALTAFATAAMAAYGAVEFARQTILTPAWLRHFALPGLILIVLEASVLVLGLRLAFERLRPEGRIIAPQGVAGYAAVCLSLFAVAWWRDGRFPPQALPFLCGGAVGVAFWVFRRPT